ncbi:MAG: hypothetical protein ACTHXA_00875 [Gulosibacter sp.]|uniref:hypothetical protein n=1 Tax=Gulosibacter sp. TaxID=2817531 RepID=UPI003F8EB563
MSNAAKLDELTIPAPQTGKPLQRLGVTAQFQLPDGHLSESRRAAIDVLLQSYEIAQGAFEQWMIAADNRPGG